MTAEYLYPTTPLLNVTFIDMKSVAGNKSDQVVTVFHHVLEKCFHSNVTKLLCQLSQVKQNLFNIYPLILMQ